MRPALVRFLLLTALQSAAARGQPTVAAPPDTEAEPSPLRSPEEVKETLKAILESPEYRRLPRPIEKEEEEAAEPRKLPGWLERFLDWLLGGPERSPGSRSFRLPAVLGGLLRVVLYLAVGAAFGFVLFLILKSVLRRTPGKQDRSRRPSAAGEALSLTTPPGEIPAEEYLSRALTLAQTGKYKDAIRQLLLGTMSWTERQGLVRFRKGLTNRDYLRANWHRPRQREPLAALIMVFDQIYFGRRPATAQRWEECLKNYRAGFGTT